MINHSWKCNHTATLRYFIKIFFWGWGVGGEAVMPPRGKKNTHCMPVKVLGHTDLPFFIPVGLTALHENIMFE